MVTDNLYSVVYVDWYVSLLRISKCPTAIGAADEKGGFSII